MGNGTARVLAGYRRTAGRRGRGQTRPFQPADLAAVLATLGPTSPTRAAGVPARSSRESRGRHLVPITGHHGEPLFPGGAARSHAAASLPDQPPQNFTVHRYPPLELVGRDVFALLDDDPVVRRGVQSRPNPRGSSTSRASRSTSHTPSRNSAVRDSASDSGRPSRQASYSACRVRNSARAAAYRAGRGFGLARRRSWTGTPPARRSRQRRWRSAFVRPIEPNCNRYVTAGPSRKL